jgi:hypothetical protein
VNAPALIISIVALVLTAYNTLWLQRWRDERYRRRELFLRMHERLTNPELARGRAIIYGLNSLEQAQAIVASKDERFELANQAMAMMDVLAAFVHYGYLDREVVLTEWGQPLARLREPGGFFIEARRQEHGAAPWSHFRTIAREAYEAQSVQGST